MQFHPVAGIFPMMSDPEIETLAADIAKNDLREAIWTYQGQIIDGRNRFTACEIAGVDPRYREYEGEPTNLVSFVVSLNLHRRHLTESQRAMVAAKVSTFQLGDNQFTVSGEGPQICVPVTQTQAAEMLNVSERSVSSAKKVIEKGVPELVAMVESGEVAVSRAATFASMSESKQKSAIKKGRVSGKKLIDRLRVKALRNTDKGYVSCLHCSPHAKYDEDTVSAFMQKLAKRAADFAREHRTESFASYFEGVAFDIAEGELSYLQMDNQEKVLACIGSGTIDGEAGLRERSDLQKLTKIPWAELNDLLPKMIKGNQIEALQQQGKTEVARGARKTIYRRVLRTPGETHVEREPEDIYHDSFAENW